MKLGAAFGVDKAWHKSESDKGNTYVLATRCLIKASTRNNGVRMIQLIKIKALRCLLALKILKLISNSERNVTQV